VRRIDALRTRKPIYFKPVTIQIFCEDDAGGENKRSDEKEFHMTLKHTSAGEFGYSAVGTKENKKLRMFLMVGSIGFTFNTKRVET
jgi:hypothetical protein